MIIVTCYAQVFISRVTCRSTDVQIALDRRGSRRQMAEIGTSCGGRRPNIIIAADEFYNVGVWIRSARRDFTSTTKDMTDLPAA
jgi:hypothetical protein